MKIKKFDILILKNISLLFINKKKKEEGIFSSCSVLEILVLDRVEKEEVVSIRVNGKCEITELVE